MRFFKNIRLFKDSRIYFSFCNAKFHGGIALYCKYFHNQESQIKVWVQVILRLKNLENSVYWIRSRFLGPQICCPGLGATGTAIHMPVHSQAHACMGTRIFSGNCLHASHTLNSHTQVTPSYPHLVTAPVVPRDCEHPRFLQSTKLLYELVFSITCILGWKWDAES